MTNKEVIIKLRNELEQLRQKIMNLEIFLLTSKYKAMEVERPRQAELLTIQLKQMKEYQNTLIERIALIQDDIDGENND